MANNTPNIVEFGLSNVYFALVEFDAQMNASFGTPHKHPGAVNLQMDVNGSTNPFYADNIVYYNATSNQGFTGTMTFALMDEWFKINVLGYIKDSNGVLVENANATIKPVAMMFQKEGDQSSVRKLYYNVQFSRLSETAETKTDTTTPTTAALTATATPLPNTQDVKAEVSADTPPEVIDNWFNEVYIKNGTYEADATLSALSLGAATLTPTFDPAVTEYTADTTSATNTITATASKSTANVVIMANGSPVTNGSAITWNDGSNAVVITVTNGAAEETYTINVTKTT